MWIPPTYLAIVSLCLAVVTFIFDVAAASGPWATASGGGATATLGLLQLIECFGGSCITVNLSDLNGLSSADKSSRQAAAAFLYLGFIFALAQTALLLMVLFSKGFRDTAISFPALMGVSVTVLVCSFIGCVIGGNQMQSSINSSGNSSPGLALSIIAVVLSAASVGICRFAIPTGAAASAAGASATASSAPADPAVTETAKPQAVPV